MSALTPTPLPRLRPDEVTQPSVPMAMVADEHRRGGARSPAQWEAEAMALVDEADAREGAPAGALRYAAASLLEEEVGDVAAAMDHLRLALEDPPELTFRPVLRALRLHAVETGSFWTALDLLNFERKAAADPVERADLAVERATLLGHALDAPARAREVLEEALSQQPGHAAALLALEENTLGALGRGGGAADGALLQSVLERRLAGARSSGERGRLLCRLALLAEADPARIADALGLWLRALEEEDGKGELRQRADGKGELRLASLGASALARAGARRAAAALGRYPERARIVALEADATAGPERAGWLCLGAALARYRLGGPARADELIEAAHAADPADPAPLFAMTSAALATGQWAKARLALDRQAELSRDRDWAATLQGLGAHIAELHEGNDDAAAGRYRRLLEARASDPVALAALERIASRTGDAAGQVALAESAVDRSGEPAERAALAMRAAELAETAGHDLPRAAALARRALEAVPGYAPAAHLLERVLPALDRWDEMAKVVEVTAAPTSLGDAGTTVDAEAAVRLERLGALYEDRLADPGKALALYGEWVDLGTRRGAALGALLRAAEKAGDALVAAEAALRLGTEIPAFDKATRFAWCFRAGTIFEERAAADDEAVRAYEAALALAPGSRPVLAGLARAHHRRGRFEALAAVLTQQAANEANPASASSFEVEAARLFALRLGRLDDALAATSRALTFDPANVEAIAEHARLLQRLGRADELVAALGTLGQTVSDPVDKAAAYRAQAEVLEWQLGRRREALAAIERAVGTGADTRAAVAEDRLWRLVGRGAELRARHLKRLAAADEAVRAAGREAGRRPRGPGGAEVGLRLDLAWHLHDPEAALNVLQGALEAAPGDPAVLDAELALAFRFRRDREAAAAMEKLAAASDDDDTRAALWQAAARARERVGQTASETLPLLNRLVEARGTEETLTLFARAAARAGDSARLILARRRRAEAAVEPLLRAVLLWDLGRARLEARDLAGADAELARALDADGAFLPALAALAQLREANGDARSAAELYARLARLTKAPGRAADAFRQAARLYANQVRDDAMAARCLEEVLAIEPEAETDFEVLQVILRARGEDDRLAQVMRRRAAAGTLPKRRDRLLALAQLLHARDPVEAAAVLAEAVKLDPASVAVLARLADVEAEIGRSAEAIATYRAAIGASADPAAVSAAWARIGDIAERALADGDQAIDAYRNALLATPDDLAALNGLARGLTRRRDYREAAIVLRRLAALEAEPEARVGHLLTLGELLAGPADDPDGAASAFEQALALDPGNDQALDRLDEMLTRLDEPARLAAALGHYLEVAPTSRARRMRLAALWSGPLASPSRAVDELRIVVAASDTDVEARVELGRVLEGADRLTDAIAEHLALLRLEPLRVESLQALRRLCERAGQRRRAGRVAAALAALGLADPAEARAIREGRARWSPEARGTIATAEFESVLRHPDARHPATALLAAMSEVLPRLYGLALEDWGVTKQDRLPPRSDDPVRGLVGRVATLLGVEDGFEVYQARAIASQVEIEAGPPPSLLLPPGFTALPRQEAYLQLGRQLGHLRAGTYAIGRIPGKDLGLLVAAGVRTVYPGYGRGILPEEQLNDVSQKIARMLPRRQRRAFEQAALSFRDAGLFDGERWRGGLGHTGYRAALVASGDVLGAFEQIARADRRLAAAVLQPPEELWAVARTHAGVVEMIHFAIGEELGALNRRLGTD
jgi:tetratricopeptide (TPR) repeat protein